MRRQTVARSFDRRRIASRAGALLFGMVLVFAACTTDTVETDANGVAEAPDTDVDPTATEPSNGEPPDSTLRVAVAEDSRTFDLQYAGTPRGLEVIFNVYEHTMSYDLFETGEGFRVRGTEPVGRLLESMTLSDDQLTWTLRLRPGQTFSDGSRVTAESVYLIFERGFNLEDSGGRFIYTGPANIGSLDNVVVVDELTLEITTLAPNHILPAILALSNSAPVNPAVFQEHATDDDPYATEWLAANAAGGGPYVLESWEPGVQVILQANPFYSGEQQPAIDRVVIRIVPDSANRVALLLSGEVDIATDLSPDEVESLDGQPGVTVISAPLTNLMIAGMNLDRPPFDDLLVRQAISHAIPYEEIISSVYHGRAQKPKGPVPLGFPDQYEGADLYPAQDLDQAETLLSQSNHADGFQTTLSITDDPTHEAVAILIQSALGQIGIEVSIDQLPPTVYDQRLVERDFDFFINAYASSVTDPVYASSLRFVCGSFFNHTNFCDESVDIMLREAGAELDADVRSAVLRDVQVRIAEAAPVAWLVQPNLNFAVRDNISGFAHFDDRNIRYYYLEKAPAN